MIFIFILFIYFFYMHWVVCCIWTWHDFTCFSSTSYQTIMLQQVNNTHGCPVSQIKQGVTSPNCFSQSSGRANIDFVCLSNLNPIFHALQWNEDFAFDVSHSNIMRILKSCVFFLRSVIKAYCFFPVLMVLILIFYSCEALWDVILWKVHTCLT